MSSLVGHHPAGKRGMALVLVIAVLATAAVLGYALLSTNTLQAQISSNLMQATSAEYVAESGVNVGLYYLQSPASAPTSWSSTPGYTLFATAVPLNDGTESNFNLSVTANPQPSSYNIVSTGWPSTGSAFSHTATATVTVNRAPIPGAGVFGGAFTVPTGTTISSDGGSADVAIQADGSVALAGGRVSGTIASPPLAHNGYVVPTAATVNYYGVGTAGGTYLWTDGVTLGTPQQITTPTLTPHNLPTRLPSNPAGIFYCQGNLTITGSVTINGTLIVRGGTLTVQASPTIIPAAQFPALICEQNVVINGNNRLFTANGVVFLGTGLSWAGANNKFSFLNVNGALIMPAGASIAPSAKGAVNVTYVAANTNVPLLTSFNEPALSIQVNSWNQ